MFNQSMQRNSLVDDGLETPKVGAWAEEKYSFLQGYAKVFATSMKRKWIRVYIDLFAGSGRSRIEGSNRIVLASPLLTLEIPDRFDRYIFCEKSDKKIYALSKRVASGYPGTDVRFVHGDANLQVDEVLREFPRHSATKKVLAFCFADPFSLDNLKFSTIEQLASRSIDFLILIPTEMDANRNMRLYCASTNKTLDNCFGTNEWRPKWESAKRQQEPPWGFVIKFYAERMRKLGYLDRSAEHAQLIRSTGNLPLYRLTFFSRHPLGERFWKEIKKYSNPQNSLNF